MFGDDSNIAIFIGIGVAILVVVVGQCFSRKPSSATTGDKLTGNDLPFAQEYPHDPLPQTGSRPSPLRQLIKPVILLGGFGAVIVFVLIPYYKTLFKARESIQDQTKAQLLNKFESIQSQINKPLDIPTSTSPFNSTTPMSPPAFATPPAQKFQTTIPVPYIPPQRPIGARR
jgi:hypothetical protein